MKSFKSAYVALSLLSVLILAGAAQASNFLSMSPGQSETRDFVLYNQFQASKLGPIKPFILMGQGTDLSPMGSLTITIKPTITKDFGSVVEFSLICLAYPLADISNPFGGTPVFVNVTTSAPLSLTNVVKMNAKYGLVVLGVFIKSVADGDVTWPAQFNITFAWAAGTTTTTTTAAATSVME